MLGEMRRALVLVIVSACAGSAAHGPAWPKPHDQEADGGESLAPHVASQVAAIGITKDEDDEGKPATATTGAGSAATTAVTATPAATTPATQTPTDETINTEEIIIEIDD
jgi:hypothetical protein